MIRGVLCALILLDSPILGHASAVAGVSGRCATPYALEIDAAVADSSRVWTVPPSLVKAIIHRESAFNPTALSRAGAVGLMQVLPQNAERLGVRPEDLWVPRLNILAGTRLLAVLLQHYEGDVVSALVAYNARPRRMFAPLPETGETALYVRRVLEDWRRFQRCEPNEAPAESAHRGRRSSLSIAPSPNAVTRYPLLGRGRAQTSSQRPFPKLPRRVGQVCAGIGAFAVARLPKPTAKKP